MADIDNKNFTHELSDYWVVEWSHSQQSFHVDPMKMTLKRNIGKLAKNETTDWVIIAVTKTGNEAIRIAEDFDTTYRR